MNNNRGITTLEAALGLLVLGTILFTGFAVVNGVRETFQVSGITDDVLKTQNVRPLNLVTSSEGIVDAQVNVSELGALLTSISSTVASKYSESEEDYYFEIAYAVADINTVNGQLLSLALPTNNQRLVTGAYSPSSEALEQTDLTRQFQSVVATTRSVTVGDEVSDVPLSATLVGVRDGSASTQNFVGRAVILGARLVTRIEDTYTRTVWRQISGSDEVHTVRAFVLRGDVR